jgi:hypothetical protein
VNILLSFVFLLVASCKTVSSKTRDDMSILNQVPGPTVSRSNKLVLKNSSGGPVSIAYFVINQNPIARDGCPECGSASSITENFPWKEIANSAEVQLDFSNVLCVAVKRSDEDVLTSWGSSSGTAIPAGNVERIIRTYDAQNHNNVAYVKNVDGTSVRIDAASVGNVFSKLIDDGHVTQPITCRIFRYSGVMEVGEGRAGSQLVSSPGTNADSFERINVTVTNRTNNEIEVGSNENYSFFQLIPQGVDESKITLKVSAFEKIQPNASKVFSMDQSGGTRTEMKGRCVVIRRGLEKYDHQDVGFRLYLNSQIPTNYTEIFTNGAFESLTTESNHIYTGATEEEAILAANEREPWDLTKRRCLPYNMSTTIFVDN